VGKSSTSACADSQAIVAAVPITAKASRVNVYVIPTDEDKMIAEYTVKHIARAAC